MGFVVGGAESGVEGFNALGAGGAARAVLVRMAEVLQQVSVAWRVGRTLVEGFKRMAAAEGVGSS